MLFKDDNDDDYDYKNTSYNGIELTSSTKSINILKPTMSFIENREKTKEIAKIKQDKILRKMNKKIKKEIEQPNFKIDEKEYLFENTSLFFLSSSNKFRIFIVSILVNSYFENFILFVIGFNSILYGISDFSHVDASGNLIIYIICTIYLLSL